MRIGHGYVERNVACVIASVFKQSFPEQKKRKLLYEIRCQLELRILKLEIAHALKTVSIKSAHLLTCVCTVKG